MKTPEIRALLAYKTKASLWASRIPLLVKPYQKTCQIIALSLLIVACKGTKSTVDNQDEIKQDDAVVAVIEEELKTYFNLFPNIDEIAIVRLPEGLIDSLKAEFYAKEELLYFYPSLKLQQFFDSTEMAYQQLDSLRIEQQLKDDTLQKLPRKSFLTYVPYDLPKTATSQAAILRYFLEFDPESNFRKTVFFPFTKDYENLDGFKTRLQIELKFQLLDWFWFKKLPEPQRARVEQVEIKADRIGFKIDYPWIDATEELRRQTGEGLYVGTSKQYQHILDSIQRLNRFDNPYFTGRQVLWVNVYNDKIFISPFLIRAAYLKAVLSRGKSFLDFTQNKNVKFNYYAQSVLPEITGLTGVETNDIMVDIAGLKRTFHRSFAFITGHELAHIYLAEGSQPQLNETLCDCYAAVYYKRSIHDLPSLEESFYQNTYEYDLGIYKSFMYQSVRQGLGDFWGFNEQVQESDFMKRYNFIDSLSLITYPDFSICDQQSNQ